MTEDQDNLLSDARILLVDSDVSVRQALRAYFSDVTKLFTTIDSAEQALPLLEGPLWDIVVCNLKLPGMNGLEFCRRVRQMKPRTRLILSTRHQNPSLMEKAAKIGVSEIISAPLSPEKLIATLIRLHLDTEKVDQSVNRRALVQPESPEHVSVLELDETMIITAFIRFNEEFRQISPDKCNWIQHNFKGARAIVNRGDQTIELTVREIRAGDDILKLFELPVALMRLTFVRKQLIRDLKARGFLAFEVRRKPTEKTLQQKIRQGAIDRTAAFIEKVSEHISLRDEVGETIQAIFADHDGESIDTYDLVGHVNRITEAGAAQAISAIAALKKGDQLYTHSVDVGAIFLTVYTHWYKSGEIICGFENHAEIMLSAILHDIGKIFIPEGVRSSREKFDVLSPQMQMMREHPKYSADILSRMGLSKIAVNMALYHHVKMNISMVSSYPAVISYEEVLPETRLLSVVDTFQAMVGRRPYKKSWAPAAAMKYIDNLSGIEFDPNVWNAFRSAIGWYPVGSLVELNDGSKAFVVERAFHGLRRPSVVVTRNRNDEELTHNTLFDLNTEKDIFIRKGLDHYEIYGETAINRFVQLQVS